MSKYFLFFMVVSFVVSTGAIAREQLVVVAHTQEPLGFMEKHEVRNLFMGGISANLTPVAFAPGVKERLIFNTRIVGLTESRIQSYWAQMRFSGRNLPPVEVSSVDDMLDYLLQHEGCVGYLPADIELPSSLSVIYRL